MKNKQKNPLYVVKDQNVEQASGVFDFIVKKLNLGPVLNLLQTLLDLLMEQVNSYPMFKVFKDFFDLIVKKLELFQKISVL